VLRPSICLSLLLVVCRPQGLAAAECRSDGVVWTLTGNWTLNSASVGRFALVKEADYGNFQTDATGGKIVVLHKGEWSIKECSKGNCASRCEQTPTSKTTPVTETLWARVTRAISGSPQYREALSRSSGWHDSIVALEQSGGTMRADLADVFRGARERKLSVRLCPTDRAVPCNPRQYVIDWNGQTAFFSSTDLALNTFRIVEGEDESDAWVRFVAPGDRDRLRAAFASALEDIRTWSVPADAGQAPALERLHRVVLATVD
jgi:hypothetical protein